MFLNVFKIITRSLWRSKGFSLINIAGLSIGMASAALIILWIRHEASYDQFHVKKERIYEVWKQEYLNGADIECNNVTPKILAATMQKDLPEVERMVRVNWPRDFLFSVGDKKLMANGLTVDSGFLQMFSFPLLKGDPLTALNDIHSLALTQKLAKKLFGDEDPIGKIVTIDNLDNFKVTALMQDPPANTRFSFDYLMSWAYLKHMGEDDSYWGNNSTFTFAMLSPNAAASSVASKLKLFRKKYDGGNPKGEFFLYPIKKWRLYSNFVNGKEEGGRIVLITMFSVIAAFILLIACINFMNLSTARSEKRAKEVGIRKVVGARKSSLLGRFMGESLLMAFIAAIIAVLIVETALPYFNQLTQSQLSLQYASPYFWLSALAIILLTGIIAGSYPSLFLSSFQPARTLKGSIAPVNRLVTPRKALVILQFTLAIGLIICTIVVRQQIEYAQQRDAGYNKNNLVYHNLVGNLRRQYALVKNELLSSGTATSLTRSSSPLTMQSSDSWGFEWQGKDPANKTIFTRYCIDDKISTTAGFTMVAGRDLDLSKYATDSTAAIINETAARIMNFKDPIGQIIKDDGEEWHVVGVIKDFILQSPYSSIRPIIIEGIKKDWMDVVHVKFSSAHSTAENLKNMARIFTKYNPEYPFDPHFIDEEYAKKFEDEKRVAALASLFAALAILISCLGLFGLAAYMAENRTKEIGVRKVLGASVASIAVLLSRDFLKLVIIAFLIACPLAWTAMNNWLQSYLYRTSIHWWIFFIAGAASVIIALGTVCFQAIKAAIKNPTLSLRTE